MIFSQSELMTLYRIRFYEDRHGKKPVREYIKNLSKKNDDKSKRTLKKIHEYFDILANNGTRSGLPYVRHVEGEIWELRPAQDRIFFAVWTGKSFVMLHQFTKKTPKTPKKELNTAKKRYKELQERGLSDD